MSTDTLLPFALYQAHLRLWLRAQALLQESQAQWVALGTQTLRDGIDEVRCETGDLLQSASWPALAALPAHTFWHGVQGQVTAAQGVVQTALGNQASFAAGWRRALADWQEASADAVGGILRTQAAPPATAAAGTH